ncbi:chemotaxis protein CheW [Pseudoroseicyclus sp. CXY001]|uniref:chemotaxis protein CheW n=1 Tax=Pseudoroseicyclus sp. CXY001 TaxID=3242492 RepID=UPI00358DA9C1
MQLVDTVVTFSVAGSLFAVEVAMVQEILSPQRPSRLPNAPPHLLGLIDVRGHSVVLVDLRRILGEPARAEDEDTRILLLSLPGTGGAVHRVALQVDRVIEVAALDQDGLVAPVGEAEMLAWDPRMLRGIGRRNGAITALLDVSEVLDPGLIVAAAAPAPAPRQAPADRGLAGVVLDMESDLESDMAFGTGAGLEAGPGASADGWPCRP